MTDIDTLLAADRAPGAASRWLTIGIDPGLSGALALLSPDGELLAVADMPTAEAVKGRRRVSEAMLAQTLRDWMHVHRIGGMRVRAVIEQVHAMPKQGVSAMFSFGASYGAARGVLAGLSIPTHEMTPQKWHRACGLRLVGHTKDASRGRAAQLFPRFAGDFSRKRDDGRAEAALIAWAGMSLLTSG